MARAWRAWRRPTLREVMNKKQIESVRKGETGPSETEGALRLMVSSTRKKVTKRKSLK